MNDDLELMLRFAIAIGLGLFLGLERERDKPEAVRFAGVRTFSLITLCGALSGFVDLHLGKPWLGLLIFGAVGALIVVSYVKTVRGRDVGSTTQFAAFVAFLLGLLCIHDQIFLAGSLAVVTGALLSLRERLHDMAARISSEDVEATIKFAVIALIVLPLVPDRTWGPPPLDALNPRRIWLFVVLISGVDFASYLLVKGLGPQHGIGLSGILGGLVSSTALTLGFARRSRAEPAASPSLALGILLAWTISFLRVMVIAGIVALPLLPRVALGLAVPAAAALVCVAVLWRNASSKREGQVDAGANPFALFQAIKFGLLFAAVLLMAKAAQVYLGTGGLYAAGALAGTVDVDAITLSMAELAQREPDGLGVPALAIQIAVLSNTLVKGGMTIVLGSPAMRKVMLPLVGIVAGACVAGMLIT